MSLRCKYNLISVLLIGTAMNPTCPDCGGDLCQRALSSAYECDSIFEPGLTDKTTRTEPETTVDIDVAGLLIDVKELKTLLEDLNRRDQLRHQYVIESVREIKNDLKMLWIAISELRKKTDRLDPRGD